ncbi:hypothetical protein Droror1_Dr00024610 [Drosera rotundifolia]
MVIRNLKLRSGTLLTLSLDLLSMIDQSHETLNPPSFISLDRRAKEREIEGGGGLSGSLGSNCVRGAARVLLLGSFGRLFPVVHGFGDQSDENWRWTWCAWAVDGVEFRCCLRVLSPRELRYGFSLKVVDVLRQENVEFQSFDILADDEVNQSLKVYSNWSSYSQLLSRKEEHKELEAVR